MIPVTPSPPLGGEVIVFGENNLLFVRFLQENALVRVRGVKRLDILLFQVVKPLLHTPLIDFGTACAITVNYVVSIKLPTLLEKNHKKRNDTAVLPVSSLNIQKK